MSERPEDCETEHLEFLDDLRESGQCNMFGAWPFLMDEFMIGKKDAAAILTYWMKTFGHKDR